MRVRGMLRGAQGISVRYGRSGRGAARGCGGRDRLLSLSGWGIGVPCSRLRSAHGRDSGDRRRNSVRPDQGQEHRLYRRISDEYRHRPQGSRVVADDEADIVDALNALRARYTYVFTTGGIGPTHDDITADSVARAFGVGIDHHPEVVERFRARFGAEINEARLRMARIPDGADADLQREGSRARIHARQCRRHGRRAGDHAGACSTSSRRS